MHEVYLTIHFLILLLYDMKVVQSCLTLCDHGILQVKHCSGQPFPSPGDLPKPGIEPRSPALQADSLPAEPQGKPHQHPEPTNSCPSCRWCHPTISSSLIPISPSPPTFSLSQHQDLFKWVDSLHQVAKVLKFQL